MSHLIAVKCLSVPTCPTFFLLFKIFPLGVVLPFKIQSFVNSVIILNNRKYLRKVGTEFDSFLAMKRCSDCRFWVGRCLRGRKNVIAISEACELFEPKTSTGYQLESFLKVKAKLTFKGRLEGFLKRLEGLLFPALLPSISTGFRRGERLEGGPHKCRHLIHLCQKWRKPLGVGPLAPGPPPAPLQAPQKPFKP